MDSLRIRFESSDQELADEIARDMVEHGATITSMPRGFVPILPLVVAFVIGVGGLATVILKIIKSRGCQVLIDARSEEIKKQVDCSIRDGRIIVITKADEKVEIVDVPDAVDLTALMEAAVSGTADAVKAAATAIGANATSAA